MSITSELEKLISLRDRGDLTETEFEKAKAILLAGQTAATTSVQNASPVPLEEEGQEKKKKVQLLTAVLSTVAAVLSAISAIIATSPLKLLAFGLFAAAAIGNWIVYLRSEKKS